MNAPPTLPRATDKKPVRFSRYPGDRRYVGRSVALSVVLHVLFAALVCLLAYWFGIVRLKDLLNKGGSLAESGPAPEQAMTVNLVMAQPRPPPPVPTPKPVPVPTPEAKPTPTPTPQALPVLPPIQLKIVTPAPAPASVPSSSPTTVAASAKPTAKPIAKPKPKFTAAHATGQGKSQNISPARVGTTGLPAPSYPAEALARHEGGTVSMQVLFGPDGAVMNAEIQQSSGYSILDVSTRNFIYAHWKNASLANTTIHVPVIYDPGNRATTSFP
jgi:TonB family protein